jgi:hypothetical protein
MKYVSFSLFGEYADYIEGEISNAKLMSNFYPHWNAVFYTSANVDTAVSIKLRDAGALVIPGDESISENPRVWRFAAALLPGAEHVIFRDTDSRISKREATAVGQWLESGRQIHLIRDHPHHFYPIMAGMWGVRCTPQVNELVRLVLASAHGDEKPEDQKLLAEIVYPALVADSYIHDTFYSREPHSVRLGPRDEDNSFIGERINAAGDPDVQHRKLVAKYEASNLGRLRLTVLDKIRQFVLKTTGLQLYFLLKTGPTEK